MNNIGQNSVFVFFGYFMIFPIIGELVAGFLPHHSLLNPFFASAVLLPVVPGSVQRPCRVRHVLHPFITCFSQPEFYRFSLGLGTDWISRNKVSGSAASVRYFFPSAAANFSWCQFVTDSLPSFLRSSLSLFQYFL